MEILKDNASRMQILRDTVWQMSLGERAAMEGMLNQLKPDLAIEIGTAEGASLRRIAAHARRGALLRPRRAVARAAGPTSTLHPGDSHVLLPELLAELAEAGPQRRLRARRRRSLLRRRPEATSRTCSTPTRSSAAIILIHDVNNEQVRRGVDAVRYRAWRKVAYVELDCVPGYMFREERLRHELWGGLGLIVVDAAAPAYAQPAGHAAALLRRRAAVRGDARHRRRARAGRGGAPRRASSTRCASASASSSSS